MVIPLRVQCSKDFVCNRRRHSSRSQRASLSLGIRFEADNVIVLRGESPQSSLGRASSSSCVYVCVSWKRRGKRFMPHIPNIYKQSHAGCEQYYPHSMCKLKLRNSVRPNILALRGVSRSTGDETRQPADFNRVASLSLPPCTGAKPMGCGQCACCRRLRVSSCWCCSPDRGRPDEPFWWVRGNYVAGE